MTDNIMTLKAIRRKNGLIWRKTRITINFTIYYDSSMTLKRLFQKGKLNYGNKWLLCINDLMKLFSLIHSLFGSGKITVLPGYTSYFTLVSAINMFY